MRSIAFTDFEMTGLDPCAHEIIEIGCIVVNGETFKEISRFDCRVRPQNIAAANPDSLRFVGYTDEGWREAQDLKTTLSDYSQRVEGALFAAWNTPFDFSFLNEAYRKTKLKNPFDYHTLDVFSVAFEKLKYKKDIKNLHLSTLCTYFGIAREPLPHRAINGAECVHLLYKKLCELN